MSGAEVVIVVTAMVAGAMVKAVTGMGFPLVAVPVMSLFVPLETAVAVIAIPNVTANAVLSWRERSSWPDTRDLPVLVPASVAGAVAGTFLLVTLPERLLVVVLAAAVLGYVVSRLRNPELQVGPERSARLAPPVGVVAGLFQGALGVSGPIVGAWIHTYRLTREAFVLSITLLFLVSGGAQLVVLVADGQYDRARLVAALAGLIPALGVIPLGAGVRDRLSGEGFDRAVLALLAVSALALVTRSLA